MKLYALLTVDLKNTDSEKRDKFNNALKEKKWIKISNLTTSWKASFNADSSYKGASAACISDLKTAADESKISDYSYAFQLGESEVSIN
jgi:hypothetical protein